MRQRIITAIILLVVVLPPIYYGGLIYKILIGLVAFLASMELIDMAKINRKSIPSILTYFGTLSIVFFDDINNIISEYLNAGMIQMLFIMLLLICTVFVTNYDFTKAGISILSMFYIGLGGYSAVTIRIENLSLFIYILLIVLSTDIGAYFIGSSIGSRKLAPSISPNKTIEGFLGGITISFLLSAIYLNFYTFNYSYIIMLIIAIALSITGQFGDLLASSYKRHFAVKDSGDLLPGHGGILDRVDSTLFTMSIALILGVI